MPFHDFNISNNSDTLYHNIIIKKNAIIKSVAFYNASVAVTWMRMFAGNFTADPAGKASIIFSAGSRKYTDVGQQVYPCIFSVNNILIPDGKLSWWQYSFGVVVTYISIYYE